MKTLLATDFRLAICGNKYYFRNAMFSIAERYFNAFGNLSFCCRVEYIDSVSDVYIEVTHMVDEVIEVESFGKCLLHMNDSLIKNAVSKCDFLIIRNPSIISIRAAEIAIKLKKPYLAENMADAWDSYWNHSLSGRLIAPYMYFMMKKTTAKANYASYVTEKFLQKRYQNKNETLCASNVNISDLDENVLNNRLNKIRDMRKEKIILMTVAGVDVHAKGHRFVIKAIPALNRDGIKVEYILVGGGDQSILRNLGEKIGVIDQLIFTGMLSRDEVLKKMDECDIYIQPSLQEGLPRAVIEAMSRACPCLGSCTAGIPELLPEECIFARRSSKAIVRAIEMMLVSDMAVQAKRNFGKAREYLDEVLAKRRTVYYDKIKREIESAKNA